MVFAFTTAGLAGALPPPELALPGWRSVIGADKQYIPIRPAYKLIGRIEGEALIHIDSH